MDHGYYGSTDRAYNSEVVPEGAVFVVVFELLLPKRFNGAGLLVDDPNISSKHVDRIVVTDTEGVLLFDLDQYRL